MNRQEFLTQLEKELYGLPDDDVQKTIEFYNEMIDDRVEDGHSEEEAIAQIDPPQEIAKQILMDIPITKLVKQKIKSKRRMRTWEIVLLAIGSPIWFSLLIAAVAVAFSIYVSLWSIIVSVWACEVAFAASALGGVAAAVVVFFLNKNAFSGLVMISAVLVLIGISILFFFVCKLSTKHMILLTKKIMLWIKSCLLRKEEA